MSTKKGIFVYTIILLGLLFAMGVILTCIMFFFPSVQILGFQFVSTSSSDHIYYVTNENTTAQDHLLQINNNVAENIEVINIDAEGFDIHIRTYDPGTSEDHTLFKIHLVAQYAGYIKADGEHLSLLVNGSQSVLAGETETKNIVNFSVIEPEGLYVKTSCYIIICIPEDSMSYDELIINSGNGDIRISPDQESDSYQFNFDEPTGELFYNFNAVKITDTTGEITLGNVVINDKLSITKTDGLLEMNTDISANVVLNATYGKYYFKDINIPSLGQDEYNVVINEKNANIILKDIEGDVEFTSQTGLLRVGEIGGNFTSKRFVDNTTNSCDIEIEAINGSVVYIENKTGIINIGRISKIANNLTQTDLSLINVEISNTSGTITINECMAQNVVITCTSGEIIINECASNLEISSTSGAIDVSYITSSSSLDGVTTTQLNQMLERLKEYSISLISDDGEITCKNSVGALTLETTSDGNINAEIYDLNGLSSITSKYGKINIKLSTAIIDGYWLRWQTTKTADIDVLTYTGDDIKSSYDMPNDSYLVIDGYLKVRSELTPLGYLSLLSTKANITVTEYIPS